MKNHIQSFLVANIATTLLSSACCAMQAPVVHDSQSLNPHSHYHQSGHYAPRYSPMSRTNLADTQITRDTVKKDIKTYLEDRMAFSLNRHQSFSWLFKKGFDKSFLNPIKESLHHAIDTLGASFFEKLLTIKNNIPPTDPGHHTLHKFLMTNHFIELTNYNVPSHAILPIYFHPTGLMVRIKPNFMQISLSMYHQGALQALMAGIQSHDRQKIEEVFAEKSDNEACKIYLGYTQPLKGGKSQLAVEPVPHAPHAVINKESIFEAPKFRHLKSPVDNFSSRDHLYLEHFWIQKVMQLGHLTMTRTAKEDVIQESWLTTPATEEVSLAEHQEFSQDWLNLIERIPAAPTGETMVWYQQHQGADNPFAQEG
jgi:hypothetical protein